MAGGGILAAIETRCRNRRRRPGSARGRYRCHRRMAVGARGEPAHPDQDPLRWECGGDRHRAAGRRRRDRLEDPSRIARHGVTTDLPDYFSSRAVLIGSGSYCQLPAIPARNNINVLWDVLVDLSSGSAAGVGNRDRPDLGCGDGRPGRRHLRCAGAVVPGAVRMGRPFPAPRQPCRGAGLPLRRPFTAEEAPGVVAAHLPAALEQLRMGPVLHWPTVNRTTVTSGRYEYGRVG